MPIDANLLLSNVQPLPQLTLPSVARARAQQNQVGDLELQQRRQQVEQEQAVRGILQQTGGNLEAALPLIAKVSPEHAFRLQSELTRQAQEKRLEQQQVEATTARQGNAQRQAQQGFDVGIWQAVEGAQTPEEKQAAFDEWISQGRAQGLRDLPQGPASLKPRAARYYGDEIAKAAFTTKPADAPKPERIVLKNPDGSERIEFRIPKEGDVYESAAPPAPRMKGTVEDWLAGDPAQRKTIEAAWKAEGNAKREPKSGEPKSDTRSLEVRAAEALARGDKAEYDRLKQVKTEFTGGSGSRITGAQNKTLGYFNRAKQADDDLQGLEGQIQKLGFLDQQRMKSLPNVMQTQLGQSYNQAQHAFTEARLRKDSGAAIPKSEFENDRVTYFAQPGDTPATLTQKAKARAAVLASLAFESGSALEGFYGDDAATMLGGFKSRAAGAAQGGNSVKMKAPNGQISTVPAAQVDHYKALGAQVVP